MKFKINATELASKLAHQLLIRTIGENNMYDDVIEEYIGTRYKPSVQTKFDYHYDKFYHDILNCIVYPFRDGQTYYTIEDDNEIVESVWDDISEEFYRENPDKKLFSTYELAQAYRI
tara:strand:- start:522 stop:872 length:351 start_codon:yes stop_codon:yes gene_type:complete